MVAVFLILLTLTLLGRLSYLQIEEFLHYRTLSDENRIALRPVPPPRGLIYDRNGELLVRNEPAFALELRPEHDEDPDKLLNRLTQTLPAIQSQQARMRQRIQESPPYRPVTLIEGLSGEQVARFTTQQHRFPAIRVRARSRRSYPQGPRTAHVLGYLGQPDDGDFRRFRSELYPQGTRIGKMGLEREYERTLHGQPGRREVETDAHGREVREVDYTPPVPGKDLILTLDADLQRKAYDVLSGYKEASLVALDPDTGGILAMVGQPSFDPNDLIGGLGQNSWTDLRQAPFNPLLNRAVQGTYPPASTVKPALAMKALALGIVDRDTTFNCNGTFKVGGDDHLFHCWKERGHGDLSIREAIIQSCDVFFYKLSRELKIRLIHETYAAFGLGTPTGIDLPNERGGLNPDIDWKKRTRGESWFPGETVMTAIGQGYIQTTPLQLGVMAAALANGGYRVTPHLARAIQDPISGDREVLPHQREPLNFARENPLALVQKAMRGVVGDRHGTARRLRGGRVPLAGKTGTAQVVRIDRDREEELEPEEKERRVRDHALFVAYAPADDPEIALAVVVEHGISGGKTAGRVARQVVDNYFSGPDS